MAHPTPAPAAFFDVSRDVGVDRVVNVINVGLVDVDDAKRSRPPTTSSLRATRCGEASDDHRGGNG